SPCPRLPRSPPACRRRRGTPPGRPPPPPSRTPRPVPCQSSLRLLPADALLVQSGQPPAAVVLALERRIGRAVVLRPELLRRVERRRVQPLPAAQRRDLRFHQAVVVPVLVPRGQGHCPPETEVHVPPARP